MLNTSTFIGYICTDPVFTGKDDIQYCKFVLAVPRDYKTESGDRPADFISCVVFGVSAELIYTNFSKGKKICVSGRMESSKYVGSDGNNRYDTSLKVKKWYYEEPKPSTFEDLKALVEG